MTNAANIINTIAGQLVIITKKDLIVSCRFIDIDVDKEPEQINTNREIEKNIKKYFNGKLKYLPNKLKLEGTAFQLKVYNAIMDIAYGCTKTYKEIAIEIGHPTACRAVANACSSNKLAIFVPCHRVVGANNIGGYKWGIDKKQILLDFERKNC